MDLLERLTDIQTLVMRTRLGSLLLRMMVDDELISKCSRFDRRKSGILTVRLSGEPPLCGVVGTRYVSLGQVCVLYNRDAERAAMKRFTRGRT